MTSTEMNDRQRRLYDAEKFVKAVKELKEKDRGLFSSLKRNAGSTFGEARNATGFYRLETDESRGKLQETYFLVATLIATNPYPGDRTLAKTWRDYHVATNQKSGLERRFLLLLDSDFDYDNKGPAGGEIAYRLRQVVKQLASQRKGIDWAGLIVDLAEWGRSDKRVQKRWASEFFSTYNPTETESTEQI